MVTAVNLDLFEELNSEYASRALVARPHSGTSSDFQRYATRTLAQARRHVTVAGRDVLELGCGEGWLTSCLASEGEAHSVIGVDVKAGKHWKRHENGRVAFVVGDLSRQALVPDESVDAVISTVVFEHVRRPIAMLSALHRALRPDGIAWLNFNLYRGPKASHVYRHVYFPWPHLLFSDDVCHEFFRRHHGAARTFSWVNKLTAASYVLLARDVGFETQAAELDLTDIDIAFYRRFENELGRYPALDLEADFMTLVLRKSVTSVSTIWPLEYLARQEAFEESLAA